MISSRERPYSPIGDYAAIGDCSVVALVSRRGSIDWLCLPNFSSPSVFGALLDAGRGGHFQIKPVDDPCRVVRRYVDQTNVLQTDFVTDSGTLRVTDALSVESERQKRVHLTPERELLRKVECLDGTVAVDMEFAPRPNYARSIPSLDERGQLGVFCDLGGQVMVLRANFELRADHQAGVVRARRRLRAGQRAFVSMSFDDMEPAALTVLGAAADDRLDNTVRWWRQWADRCAYRGAYRPDVIRSALVLKLLAYPLSGAIIAAPTTSLPEQPGGQSNWDYRYCWLRDASMTVRALLELDFGDESESFLGWLLEATRLTWPKLQVMYDIFGESHLPERCVDRLEGYRQSRPVRVGNDAYKQVQMGIYGEVIAAVYHHVRHGRGLDWSEARMLRGLGKVVCDQWRQPDAGIWESRGEPSHHTQSKAMCWVGLDRLLRLAESGYIEVPRERYRAERDAIAEAVETRGWNPAINSYVGVFGDDKLDASLFLLGIYGYGGGPPERLESTCRRLRERLGVDGDLIHRFRHGYDACAGDVAPFGICSFWYVSALARQGRLDRAEAVFDQLIAYGNDVGLFGEKIEPDSGAALGNFPQAFTHVGLINAAVTIAEQRGQMSTRTDPPELGRRGVSQ